MKIKIPYIVYQGETSDNEILEFEEEELFGYDSYPRKMILEAEILLLNENKSIKIGVMGLSYIGPVSGEFAKKQLPLVEEALEELKLKANARK